MTLRQTFKLGKKLCYPNVPSNWVCHKLGRIIGRQNFGCRSTKRILYPYRGAHVFYNRYDSDDVFYCDHFDSAPNYYNIRSINHAKDAVSWSNENYARVSLFLQNQIPKYFDEMNDEMMVAIERGKHFDVISWLSTYAGEEEKAYLVNKNGDMVQVEGLKGKKILVCCVYIPIFWKSFDACYIRALPYVCSLGNYELVVVPKLRCNWVDDEDAFNHFLSGLPSSALVVPFSDTLRGDFLCKSLGLVSHPKFLLVDDEKQMVLEGCDQHIPGFPSHFYVFDAHWWKTHSQLDAILDVKPCDFVYNISPEGGKMSIAKLKEKLVGLYLCTDGMLIRPLNIIYRECKARNLEFEVVLVYVPETLGSDVDPQQFQEAINHALHIMNVSGWWYSPFNDFVSRKLYQGISNWADYYPTKDQLIILGPQNKFVDPYGKNVMIDFGINAYPFTREHLVERELEELRALTLESLVAYGSHDHLLSSRNIENPFLEFDEIPVAAVSGKTVLLYADRVGTLDPRLYFPLLNWYVRFKTAEAPDFEVVFVDLDGGDESLSKAMLMPWLVCPFDPQRVAFIKNTLLKGRLAVIAAFGKDGKIITLNAQDVLASYEPDDFSSYGSQQSLRNEVIMNIELNSITEVKMSDILV